MELVAIDVVPPARPAARRALHLGTPGLRHAPGLDGLRALAVTAVVAYHLGAGWLPGGFLGVDVFFVLSGYLITGLLVAEWQRHGRIDVGRFYLRRARRLLPALFTLLALVVVLTAAIDPARLVRLRGDVIAAVAYVTNWTQIAWNRSYFQALGPPSALQHLWSLAVEEQFYLIWPLVLVCCLATRRPRLPLAVSVAGVAASTALMATWYVPGEDPSRVYYGSDTRAAALLVGAALALMLTGRRPATRAAADLIALPGAVFLGWAMARATSYDARLYDGGFLAVAVAAAAIVYAAAGAATCTARVLGCAPLRWIGVRSYAVYLWHWPIIVLTASLARGPLAGPPLVLARIALTVLAAAASYRLIEQPIRTRGLLAGIRGAGAPARQTLVVLAGSTAVAVAALQLIGAAAPHGKAALGIQYDPAPQQTITVAPIAVAASRSASVRVPFARPVRVAFFGDSQGMTLLLNRPAGLQGTFTLFDDTIEGCGVLGGRIASRSGEVRDLDADCAGWQRTWQTRADRDRPQIAVVEIGAWEVFDDDVDGRQLRFGTPAWDDYFTRQLGAGVAPLLAAGAQVALLSVPCYQPISAGGLQALPERGDRSRTEHLNVLLRAAAAADPQRVFLIRSPAQFCTDPAVAGNTAYRWDGVHFYKPGADLEFRTISPQLLAIPRPPAH